MRLISLRIYKTFSNETIRDIKFNEFGLSLICDEENKESGSSIGKTALIRCIDICLGYKDSSILYKDPNLGENREFKKYILNNKISIKLTIKDNKNKIYILERHLFDKTMFIDGLEIKNVKQYNEKLKDLFFYGSPKTISNRQLIAKFIRIENEQAFKYLDKFVKNSVYYYCYSYFLNLYIDEDERKLLDDIDEINKKIKFIKNRYKIRNKDIFSKKIECKRKEVLSNKSKLLENDYISDFEKSDLNNFKLLSEVDKLTESKNSLKLKIKLLSKNIEKEESNLAVIDDEVLKELYADALSTFNVLNKTFDEFKKFHNDMCVLRKLRYIEEIRKCKLELENTVKKLKESQEKFTRDFVDYKMNVNEESNSIYNVYFNSKKELECIEEDFKEFVYLNNLLDENTKRINDINSLKKNNDSNKKAFKTIFEEKCLKFYGKKYEIVFNDNINKMIITINEIGGAVGTGDKKTLNCAFDFSFYDFFRMKSFDLPYFVIHDRLENIPLDDLMKIFLEARKTGIQFIIPILRDRITTLDIKEKEVIVKLSKNDKLFKF